MSILPINKETLVYGSSNGGRTVCNSDPQMNDFMLKAAQKLNLKKHIAGFSGDVSLCMPTDIEVKPINWPMLIKQGHKGLDGRFYILDFARVYPPIPPTGEKGSIFYNLLRPEFVGRYHKPLSSDSFSKFGQDSAIVHNQEVNEAFDFLMNTTIPKVDLFTDQ
jgi:hypothetical protein